MSNVIITMNTDSAAFGDDSWDEVAELGSILRRLATDMIEDEHIRERTLRDINGNTIGAIVVEES